mmetsp:Transcript_27628/g.57817  ORF Transcript_27628/g.57817 Transcript_27628/m.57817 type:complete len:404 (-) Transcript_27628:90-1301(-)|eukprot:CAMPEP_0172451372 /NCGR_PEP_ID=MMETSP1065-20121228/9439_1 /TAXON_ID=265537 /ORGANISM="Amphiprora paludosa, Strain CCMP125" /LENGTH=403 /DNA_ID=CAMNT_0013203323 /DNA_START=173 /DNA_END=1384 /DNA_ORIENTATION=+
MKSFAILSCALLTGNVESFSRLSMAQKQATVSLKAAPFDVDHIKSAGGGIPVVPAGDNSVFDPMVGGKLDSCQERIASGITYEYLSIAKIEDVEIPQDLDVAQNFLEDITGDTFAKATAPAEATVLGRVPLITKEAPGDIQHILLQLPQGFHYMEGQSISIIPPGLNEKGKRQKPRLYSIASTRYGELLDGNTVSLCVRRAEYVDPVTGVVDPAKKGVCSNYLCDISPGDKVQVAGPIGKSMLLPEDYQDKDLILVATGTGIAPFRAFLRRLFAENTVASHLYNGQAWLVLGVPVTGGLLYHDEFQEMMQKHPNQFQATYAISREMQNSKGGKLYVQDVLTQNAKVVLERLDNGAHIYFCGLKGMMPGILEALEQVATQEFGRNWNDYLSQLKKNGQWHVEVY